ncbi:4a-hydroxytetrahydrobiopterin dehydratase [Thiomicrospira cyclica]|jgi:4a-hydroxytetrahydrobiopterin dehydratase|uniref:Putative pterin-4-alpha-carbinolamine dehydratase n=1 Tax=Thiomicrospira cyclica (strain DSM 14477 / JCM 11371 / ALM1) TaxID=717773 RepID=F6D9Y5_THICA|nr:4a-hydroxytetrahydrobiopterin dehydratase [Thiomicrospira cyclica]AEG31022.1 pterin-4-alpha-carbinolamine dehydratase [Thiomicrospira cyclica ALM1]
MTDLPDLINQHCSDIPPGTKGLVIPTIESYLNMLPGWDVSLDFSSLNKTFKFKNYHQTLAFINAVAWIAHQEDHHPDIQFGYNQCVITLKTHSIKGLSQNDVIMAAKINALFT